MSERLGGLDHAAGDCRALQVLPGWRSPEVWAAYRGRAAPKLRAARLGVADRGGELTLFKKSLGRGDTDDHVGSGNPFGQDPGTPV